MNELIHTRRKFLHQAVAGVGLTAPGGLSTAADEQSAVLGARYAQTKQLLEADVAYFAGAETMMETEQPRMPGTLLLGMANVSHDQIRRAENATDHFFNTVEVIVPPGHGGHYGTVTQQPLPG